MENKFVDIDLSITGKKPFRFDKDDTRVVYINTSDTTIFGRLNESIPKLQELQQRAAKELSAYTTDGIKEDDVDGALSVFKQFNDTLLSVDAEMRNLVDNIFNAPVSAAAAPEGSMYDMFDGSCRYEHIVLAIIQQYDNNLQAEYKKMTDKSKTYTKKYGVK